MKSIAIVNQHTNNFGDAAAGTALIEQAIDVLGPEQIDVFYFRHQYSGELPVDGRVSRHHMLDRLSGADGTGRWLAAQIVSRLLTRRFRDADLKLFVDVCKRANAVLVSPAGANIGVYRDWSYVLLLLVLVMEGVRPVFFQNTVGASSSRCFNFVARRVLRRSQLSVRERASQAWLASIGMSAYLGVDTALLLRPLNKSRTEVSARYIALVPTQLSNWHSHYRGLDEKVSWRAAIAESVSEVAKQSRYRVVIVPHLFGPLSEDAYLESVAEDIGTRNCEVTIASVTSLAQYRDVLAGAEIVVSMRYHGLILAAVDGVPCVSLAYENKMVEAATYLGMSALSLDVAEATAADLRERMVLALGQRSLIVEGLRSQLADLQDIARGPLLSLLSEQLRRS